MKVMKAGQYRWKNMRGRNWASLALLSLALAVMVAGCNGEPKPVVTGCIVGNWQVTEIGPYAPLTIPAGALGNYTLESKGGSGAIAYHFGEDGVLTVDTRDVVLAMNMISGEEVIPSLVQIDGQASADYTIDGDLVKVGAFKDGDIQYQAFLDNEPMMDSKIAYEFLPLFVDPYKTARFECTDRTLSLLLLNYPGGQSPFLLERIAERAPQKSP